MRSLLWSRTQRMSSLLEIAIGGDRPHEKIIELGDAFDAGKPSAADDEGQKLLLFVRIGFVVGFFKRPDGLRFAGAARRRDT